MEFLYTRVARCAVLIMSAVSLSIHEISARCYRFIVKSQACARSIDRPGLHECKHSRIGEAKRVSATLGIACRTYVAHWQRLYMGYLCSRIDSSGGENESAWFLASTGSFTTILDSGIDCNCVYLRSTLAVGLGILAIRHCAGIQVYRCRTLVFYFDVAEEA